VSGPGSVKAAAEAVAAALAAALPVAGSLKVLPPR